MFGNKKTTFCCEIILTLFQVRPLDSKRIIAFVNHFIMKTMQLLDSFAVGTEKRILEMENRVSKMEIELQLLEAKVSLKVFFESGGC